MRRRSCVALLGTAAMAARAGHAQRSGLPVVGYLGAESPAPFASRVRAFREGLAESGFVEGESVAIDFRWAESRYDRLPALAAALAARRVAVIVAPGGAPVALAAKSATATIPIIFEMGGDPVALGVVGSLSRPEGNITGVSSLSVEASSKRLELLHEALRTVSEVGVIVNPTSPTATSQLASLHAMAETRGLRLHVLEVSAEPQFDLAFAELRQRAAQALVFTSDPFFAFRSELLAGMALRQGLPAITQSRDFPQAGGLMSYGGDFMQSHRQAGLYAGQILKGVRPVDLPVQQITRLEFVINAGTARQFGLEPPLSLLARADEVIG